MEIKKGQALFLLYLFIFYLSLPFSPTEDYSVYFLFYLAFWL